MKSFITTLILLFTCIALFSQENIIRENGKYFLERESGKIFLAKRPGYLAPWLNSSSKAEIHFSNFEKDRTTAMASAGLSIFGWGLLVGAKTMKNPQSDGWMFVSEKEALVGVGAIMGSTCALISLTHFIRARKELKKSIDAYNRKRVYPVEFQPALSEINGRLSLGLLISF